MVLLTLLSAMAAVSDWPAVLGVMFGAGGVSALVTGGVAWHKVNREHDTKVRTVAADEAERVVRSMGVVMDRATRSAEKAVAAAERCEERWTEHARYCPLLGGSSGRERRFRGGSGPADHDRGG